MERLRGGALKILVCVSEYPPYASGIGNVAYRMVKEFEKKGHTCTVCSPTGPDIALGSRNMIQRFGGVGLLYFWWRVSKYFAGKAEEWDTIWLHGPLFPRRCPFPAAVITFHTTYRGYKDMTRELRSNKFLRGYYACMQLIEKHCLRYVNSRGYLFTSVSTLVASELQAQGMHNSTVSYISVGVDVDRFRPLPNRAKLRAELHIAEDAVVLLYVGRLTHQKNLFVLVDTLAQLRNKMSQVILLVVGTGELSSPLIQYAEERGVTNVKFCGFIPNDELPRIYGCADFFIMASVYEGQPVALLEAMAAGLPPIVSNIPTMEHLVTESGAGIVVDFSDPAEAAKQIEAYVSSSRAREDCYRVREYVERTMSSSVCAEKYLELLGRTVT